MPLVVASNLISMNAQNHLGRNTIALNKSLERLASGYRINRASDDAAGLQLSEILRGQIRGQKKALDNTQDALNVMNIMDGALQTVNDNIQRIRELTVQAANDTNATNQRAAIEQEVSQLAAEITRISDQTQFNGRNLLNGSITATIGFNIQIGANSGETINLATAVSSTNPFGDLDAAALSLSGLDYDTATSASISALLSTIDTALNTLNSRRGAIGAVANRLESVVNNLQLSIENNSASESRIRDLDVAAESATMVRNQILQQSANTILAQANQTPQLALSLLGN